ncbi:MAG: 7,8-dihydro-6-hydroxymethylpterin dimethyltransferase [Clostridiales bacterium]|nr:7,8-dihydro-6-hydroxymethylpterin dimethyltransferase [Clostridiales bacterium]
MPMKTLKQTESVCPICLKPIKANLCQYEDGVYLEKVCLQHGEFCTKVWTETPTLERWLSERSLAPYDADGAREADCPNSCGICDHHQQNTCCVLLEVTSRCNLKCPICFASAAESHTADPSLHTIEAWYDMLVKRGGPFNIQLSGGEPSLRDDLPAIIELGKQKGFHFFQLNTNGIRIAEDETYLKALADAGLSCAFLQFDGLTANTHESLRGKNLIALKQKAIEQCGKYDIGVVLVPTIVRGVNDSEIGDIIRFAVSKMPVVRGVHFQPVSYFGRYPEHLRADYFTLSEVMTQIEKQTNGQLSLDHFIPPSSEHPMCSFNAKFMKTKDGGLKPMTSFGKSKASCCCSSENAAAQARDFVARQWAAPKTAVPVFQMATTNGPDLTSLDAFLEDAKQMITISGMAFQDAWTLDLDRLHYCHIHVVSPSGDLVPFCAYNLTSKSGETLHRLG